MPGGKGTSVGVIAIGIVLVLLGIKIGGLMGVFVPGALGWLLILGGVDTLRVSGVRSSDE